MKNLKEMTESELRQEKPFWPKTIEELNEYISLLTDRQHEYGTCVYAMSLSSLATFNFVAGKLGVTGFQASCADLEFIRVNRGYKDGFRIVDYHKLLYPQYANAEHFPTMEELISENIERLKSSAKDLLEKSPNAQEKVREHWKMIIDL